MKRLEFDLQVEREERLAFEQEVKMLQTKLAADYFMKAVSSERVA